MQLTKWHYLQVFIDSIKARWGSINQFIADCDKYKLKLKGTGKGSLMSLTLFLWTSIYITFESGRETELEKMNLNNL